MELSLSHSMSWAQVHPSFILSSLTVLTLLSTLLVCVRYNSWHHYSATFWLLPETPISRSCFLFLEPSLSTLPFCLTFAHTPHFDLVRFRTDCLLDMNTWMYKGSYSWSEWIVEFPWFLFHLSYVLSNYMSGQVYDRDTCAICLHVILLSSLKIKTLLFLWLANIC